MNSKLIFGVIVAAYACYVDGQSCGNGRCIPILDCPEMLALVNNKNRTPQELKQLLDAQCGFQQHTPLVCCPEPCYNPDGKPGKCVNIYKCPHLAEMLKPPYSRPDNIQYVQNSKCVGEERYSVCCGPKRIVVKNQNTRCTGIIDAFPPDPKTGCCGKETKYGDRITGGNETSIEQYPWMALIEYTKDNGPVKTLCGGALISGRYVLTAAHCVTGTILSAGTPRRVRLSEYDTSNPGKDCSVAAGMGKDCNDGTVTISIEKTIPHPEYNLKGKQNRNDIALIRLEQSAPFTDFIRPICMPDVTQTFTPPINFTAAGWGAVSETQPFSTIKLEVPLPYVPTDKCQTAYRAPGRTATLWDGQMCAGGLIGMDSCRGDSGGPLMYENFDKRYYEILGVVSFGPTPCGLPEVPGVYTKVAHYNDWIRSQMRV